MFFDRHFDRPAWEVDHTLTRHGCAEYRHQVAKHASQLRVGCAHCGKLTVQLSLDCGEYFVKQYGGQVPQWGYSKLRTARWNRFSHPDPLPKYGVSAFPTVWWWDADKAAKTGGQR